MDNLQLEKILEETNCAAGRFRVLASDQLELDGPLPVGHVRICNTDRSTGPGIHWVLFYSAPKRMEKRRQLTVIEMFDPLGLCDLSPGRFKRFIEQYDILVMNRGFPVQYDDDQFSNTCGMHCALVAHLLCDSKRVKTLDQVMMFYDLSGTKEGINYNECAALYHMLRRFANHAKIFKNLSGCVE